jgi:putative signal transducing protein
VISLYRAGNLPEAHLLADRLRENGIETFIRNEALYMTQGEMPANLLPEVCLLEPADWDPAQPVLAAFEAARRDQSTETRACPQCGEESPANFELCWRCREPFPEPP